jgi:hypothetical protein
VRRKKRSNDYLNVIAVVLLLGQWSELQYAALLVLTLAYLGKKASQRFAFAFNTRDVVDLVPVVFFLVWFYGLTIGLLRGNEVAFVMRNFAGMSLYICFYLLLVDRPDPEVLISRIVAVGLVLTGLAVLFWLIVQSLGSGVDVRTAFEIVLGQIKMGGSTGQVRVFLVSQVLAYPIMSLSLNEALVGSKSFKRPTLVFIYTLLATIVVPASKGFVLGATVIVSAHLCSWLLWHFGKKRIKKRAVLVLAVLFSAAIAFLYSDYGSIATRMFSREDVSNQKRYEQFGVLLSDASIPGNGLGAVVPGYTRSAELPYGFELSYVNVVHKFGLTSLFLFLAYCASFAKIVIVGLSNRRAAFAFGCLGFSFPAIGNPLLFAPTAVLLHVVALYVLHVPSESVHVNDMASSLSGRPDSSR